MLLTIGKITLSPADLPLESIPTLISSTRAAFLGFRAQRPLGAQASLEYSCWQSLDCGLHSAGPDSGGEWVGGGIPEHMI